MKPVDIHPSGERWLVHRPFELVVGDFRSGTVSTIAVEADAEDASEPDWENHPYHGYDLDISTACLLTPNLALAACNDLMEDSHRPHLPASRLRAGFLPANEYLPRTQIPGYDVDIASAGDGTWVTSVPGSQLQRWRMSGRVDGSDVGPEDTA